MFNNNENKTNEESTVQSGFKSMKWYKKVAVVTGGVLATMVFIGSCPRVADKFFGILGGIFGAANKRKEDETQSIENADLQAVPASEVATEDVNVFEQAM